MIQSPETEIETRSSKNVIESETRWKPLKGDLEKKKALNATGCNAFIPVDTSQGLQQIIFKTPVLLFNFLSHCCVIILDLSRPRLNQ